MELNKIFPYKYVGGGYFREKKVSKGGALKILHGEEAIKFLYDHIKLEIEKENEK